MKPNQLDLDLKQLCAQPPFRRWLLHVAKTAGIFTPTSGAIELLPYREGQRSLGLEILREASRGLPRGPGTAEQVLSLLLREANPEETDDDDREPESRNRPDAD